MPTNLEIIHEKMAKAAKTASRKSQDTDLIAISKTRRPDEIRPLLDEGHRIFGENRVQEADTKWTELRDEYSDVELHLVGQLQSNKADDAVRIFDVIHSLDRMSLVKALAKAMEKTDRKVPCFIQVNIGEEEQKGGCAIADTAKLLSAARERGLNIIGLMCVPPTQERASPYFALLAKMARELELPKLSMGMSGDFEIAIQTGATHVRVGTALFGTRE